MSHTFSRLVASSVLVLTAVVGCSLDGSMFPASRPAGATSASGQADPFAPPVPPQGFDPQQAKTRLNEIPGDPATPASGPAATPEMPRQALRRMEEARRLFSQQRFAETLTEVDAALRYNARNAEANRLGAVAALTSGKDAQAKTYAEATLAVKPDDLASHYVLGRLAEKAERAEAALLEYRTALKCPAPPTDASYRILTQHQLGLLLVQLGYYSAAVEQLELFEKAAAALDGQAVDNAELATILRVKRSVPLLALAEAQETLSHFGQAADALAKAVKLASDDAGLRVRWIKNLVRARRFDEAANEALQYATASKADPKAVELLLAVHRASGHPDRGLAAIQQVATANPENAQITLLYADALIGARQFARAVEVLNGWIAGHPDDSGARWKLIGIHRVQGNRREWLWAVAGQLAQEPADPGRARAELAQLSAKDAGDLIDAELGKPMKAAQTAPAEGHEARLAAAHDCCLGWLADRLNRSGDARTLLARAIQSKSDFVPAVVGLGELHIGGCQWDQAIPLLQSASPPDATAQAMVSRLLGRCYDGLDQFDQAAKCYRDAVGKDADDLQSMLWLGKLLERSGRAKDAASVYEQAIAADAGCMDAREQLIVNLLNRWNEGDNLKQVVAQMKEMQEKAPDHPATVRTTALVRLLMRNPPDLAGYARVLTTLVEARPDDLASRRALCMALLRMGDYDAVQREAKALLSRSSHEAEANEILAMVLMRQLKIDEAAAQLTQCLTWYPNREIFLRNLAEVRLVQQSYPRAAETWQKLLGLKPVDAKRALYRRRLISTYLQAEWYDKIRETAEGWLRNAEDEEAVAARSYLLAADAAEEKHDRYLERCRKWLEADHDDLQLRQWLLGIDSLPGGAVGGLIGAGRYDEAVATATAWAAQAPEEIAAQHMLIQTLRAVRRTADLIEICRANLALADKPQERLLPLQTLADAYVQGKRYDDAIATLKQLAAQAAQVSGTDLSFELDQMMVSFLVQAKRYDDAVAQSSKSISDQDEVDGRLERMLADEKDVARRLAITKEQEKMRQQRADVLRSLSFVYMKQNRRDLTIDCLRQAIKLAPTDAGINNDLGYTLADAGLNLEDAERMLCRAVSEVLWNGVGEDDQQAAFTDSLGWLCYKRGRFPQAQRWLSLAARMEDGQDAVIYDHLGDAEWRVGNRDAAAKAWARCLKLHDRRVAEGKDVPDEKLTTGVKTKMAEAQRSGKPVVATSEAD